MVSGVAGQGRGMEEIWWVGGVDGNDDEPDVIQRLGIGRTLQFKT